MSRCTVCGSTLKQGPSGFWRATVLARCGLRLLVCPACGRRQWAWRPRAETKPLARRPATHRSSELTERDREAFARRVEDLRRAEAQAGLAQPQRATEATLREPSRRSGQ